MGRDAEGAGRKSRSSAGRERGTSRRRPRGNATPVAAAAPSSTTRISPGLMSPSSARATFSIVGASWRRRWIVSASVAFSYCSRESSATAALNSPARAQRLGQPALADERIDRQHTRREAEDSARPRVLASAGRQLRRVKSAQAHRRQRKVPDAIRKYKSNFVQAPRSEQRPVKVTAARDKVQVSFLRTEALSQRLSRLGVVDPPAGLL